MKTLFKAAALAAMSLGLAAVAPQVASAQTRGVILSVDTQQLLTNSTAAVSGRTQIDARFNPRIQNARQALTRDETAFNNAEQAARQATPAGGKLPEAQARTYSQALQTYQNTRAAAADLQDLVNDTQNYVNSQILRAATPIIEQIRAERRAAVVIPKSTVFAVDPSTDITAAVLQRLNQSLTTVTIDPPAQAAPAQQPAQPPGR